MKTKTIITLLCLSTLLSVAVAVMINGSKESINYSGLVLENIEALSDTESDPFEDDDCTGICSSRLCISMTGEKGAYEVHSIYHYKRTSYVMLCHHYKVCDCPEGQFAIGPVIPSQDCPTNQN